MHIGRGDLMCAAVCRDIECSLEYNVLSDTQHDEDHKHCEEEEEDDDDDDNMTMVSYRSGRRSPYRSYGFNHRVL